MGWRPGVWPRGRGALSGVPPRATSLCLTVPASRVSHHPGRCIRDPLPRKQSPRRQTLTVERRSHPGPNSCLQGPNRCFSRPRGLPPPGSLASCLAEPTLPSCTLLGRWRIWGTRVVRPGVCYGTAPGMVTQSTQGGGGGAGASPVQGRKQESRALQRPQAPACQPVAATCGELPGARCPCRTSVLLESWRSSGFGGSQGRDEGLLLSWGSGRERYNWYY